MISTRRWNPGAIATATLVAWAAGFTVLTAVITVHAARLGRAAGGVPDPARIAEFAGRFAPVAGSIIGVLLAAAAGAWVARRATAHARLQGAIVGALVGVPALIGALADPRKLAVWALAVAAGALGAALIAPRAARRG